ncbi:uncharacterized protein LOC116932905 isoform X3 [Daphnia magna]|uniref:uncharacterized protein LOC116932905 isoform X3 n=2 Tax=Daphnia magna TaxID=35525 RepID=UPI001E1BD16B|nr:uncharacterized protein LOC116932905 isoform X3 [Daphnia magna]
MMQSRKAKSFLYYIALSRRWNRLSIRLSTFIFPFGREVNLFLITSSFVLFVFYVVWTAYFQKDALDVVHPNISGMEGQNQFSVQARESVKSTIKGLKSEKEMLERYVNERQNFSKNLLFEAGKIRKPLTERIAGKVKLEQRQEKNKNFQREKIEKKSVFRYFTDSQEYSDNELASSLSGSLYPGAEYYTQFSVARLEMSALIGIGSVHPGFGPVINDVLSFQYPICISSCHDFISSNTSIFIAVISAPSNFQKRNLIRQTWKNHLKVLHQEGLLEIAGFGFILGLTDNSVIQSKIEEESKIYGDLMQIRISDFYRNLSLKVAGLLNWLYRMCANIDFVLKVDDDVYVNVRNLAQFVHTYRQFSHSVFGAGDPNGGWPDRDGKWEISYEEWPWIDYPPYFLGAAVLMHGSTIVPLLAACQTTPMMPFDDVYLYGICTEKANITLHHSSGPTRCSSIFAFFL